MQKSAFKLVKFKTVCSKGVYLNSRDTLPIFCAWIRWKSLNHILEVSFFPMTLFQFPIEKKFLKIRKGVTFFRPHCCFTHSLRHILYAHQYIYLILYFHKICCVSILLPSILMIRVRDRVQLGFTVNKEKNDVFSWEDNHMFFVIHLCCDVVFNFKMELIKHHHHHYVLPFEKKIPTRYWPSRYL